MDPDQTESDLGPNCLQYRLPKNMSKQEEQTTKALTGGLRVNVVKKVRRNHSLNKYAGIIKQ